MFDKKHRVREQIIQNGDQVSIKQQKTTVNPPLDPNSYDSSPTLPFLLNVYGLGTTSPESCEEGKESDEEDEIVTRLEKLRCTSMRFSSERKPKIIADRRS